MTLIGPNDVVSPTAEFKDPDDDSSSWWLLNFYLELPFYMPYLSGATYNVELAQESWVSSVPTDVPVPNVLLKLIQRPIPPPADPSPAMQITLQRLLHDRGTDELRTFFDGGWQPSQPPLHIVSIVEAVTPKMLLRSEKDAGLPDHPDTYLTRCLGAFNPWIRSIVVATGRTTVRTISRENLPMILAFFHQRPSDSVIVRCDFIQINDKPATSPNSFVTKRSVELIRRTGSSIDDSHGVWKAAEWRQAALHLGSVEGRHDLAIVALNTALEVLVFGLARVLFVDEGIEMDEIDRQLGGRLRVVDVCHRFLQPRIGGRWDRTDPACEFGSLVQHLVKLRNDVTHRGASVSAKQTSTAFMSYLRFGEFLTKQVGAKRQRYPRAFMDLVNGRNAAPDVQIGAAFSRLGSQIVDATPRYWLPASDHRQVVPPPAIIYATPGTLPTTVRPEKAAEWESTNESFMHLVLQRPQP